MDARIKEALSVMLDEGRGRPRKNPDDPKWHKKPQHASADDDSDSGGGADSGHEADQHIHVQLRKAADNKPGADSKGGAHVTFGDGSKHFVKHDVAHAVTSAVEKLHPDHRPKVHDMISKSHENLMAVHAAISKGKK